MAKEPSMSEIKNRENSVIQKAKVNLATEMENLDNSLESLFGDMNSVLYPEDTNNVKDFQTEPTPLSSELAMYLDQRSEYIRVLIRKINKIRERLEL